MIPPALAFQLAKMHAHLILGWPHCCPALVPRVMSACITCRQQICCLDLGRGWQHLNHQWSIVITNACSALIAPELSLSLAWTVCFWCACRSFRFIIQDSINYSVSPCISSHWRAQWLLVQPICNIIMLSVSTWWFLSDTTAVILWALADCIIMYIYLSPANLRTGIVVAEGSCCGCT